MRTLPFLSLFLLVPGLAGCSAESEDALVEDFVAGRPLRMQYTCNFSTLELRTLREDGHEDVERVALTFSSDCQNARNQLATTRTNIARPSFLAVCNRSTLVRFAASPIGRLNALSPTEFTFTSDCAREAARINQPMSTVPGEVARIDYTCSGRSLLEMRVIGGQAVEQSAEHTFRFASDCSSTADALRPTRTDIRRTVALGICDGDSVLHHYSVTRAGSLAERGTTSFSFASDCRRAMQEANR
jgi:hypothetical protein